MDIIWFDTIDSTNKEALRLIDTADDFTVIATEYQTSGRGQKGTNWESAPGKNLTFSIILKPDTVRAEKQFVISQIVALGVTSYLNKLSIKAKIKWPNDIYVGDKKICGILIENFVEGANLSASIVGVGPYTGWMSFILTRRLREEIDLKAGLLVLTRVLAL